MFSPLRKMFMVYRDPENEQGGGDSGETVVPTADPTPTLAEQIAAGVREGVRAELADAEARNAAARTPATPAAPVVYGDATQEAIVAIDLREQLGDEVNEILKDAPLEVKNAARAEMRKFTTLTDLQTVQQANIHKTIAYAALGEATKNGKYVPPNLAAPSVTREPAYVEPVPTISSAYRSEVAEIEAFLGVKFDDAEVRKAMAMKGMN